MDTHETTPVPAEALAGRFDLLAADAREYALFLTDTTGRMICWNRGAERLFGYGTGEVMGHHFSQFYCAEDIIGGGPEYDLETARKEGRCDGNRWQLRKDGSRFWCNTTMTAMYNHDKQIHAFARLTHDLTDGQALEAQAKRAEDLAEANRGKEEFMAMLSHELRNPLSPILNALGILKQMRTDDPVILQAGGIIGRQVKQMVRMVDDLLDISRITKGKLRLTKERVELRTVINQAADSARPFIEARHHEFSLLLPNAPLWVDGDAARLEQVAVNLLTNAAKYTDPGGRISMTVSREGDDAVIRVCDNGVGISATMLPRIFDLFTQVDASLSRSHGGLGIGLALVRTLVEMHGGRVTAASKGLGRGSEFAVKMPVLEGPAGRLIPATLEPGMRPGQALRVLVVEDNVDAGDSLRMLLSLYGHEVLVARTGASALELASSFHPLLVLCDIGLPGMDGYEVARRLRADPSLTGMTLCALTGYTPSEADRLRPQQAGFDYHFVKPVTVEVILDLLNKLG